MPTIGNKCTWCGSHAIPGPGPEMSPELARWKCTSCGAIGYIENPDPQLLGEMYKLAWSEASGRGKFAAGSTSAEIARSLCRATNVVMEKGQVLDYGAGTGFFVKFIAEAGGNVAALEPYGIDPNIPGVFWYRSWQEIDSRVRFDWIFLVEVLEHLLDPVDELKTIRERLVTGGKVLITTPNARGWRSLLEGFGWREAQNPTHINLFSEKSLGVCLKLAGFRRIKRLYKPVQYNSRGLEKLALAVTQILGIDGGLRIIAEVHG